MKPLGSSSDGPADAERAGVENTSRLLHERLTRVVLGAFYSTHTQLGCGFLEPVYANALTIVLRRAGVRVDREVTYDIVFHGEVVGRYRADLVVDSKVVVEVKAARGIDPIHCAQLRNYLRASGLEVGLLLNFGHSARFKRIVLTRERVAGELDASKLQNAESAENCGVSRGKAEQHPDLSGLDP